MNLYIASDHTGYELKKQIIKYFENKNITIIDCGCFSKESSSYAEYGRKLAHAVKSEPGSLGFGLCGTGLGISYAVNRVKGIRGARICSIEDAILAKKHNNANILLFGARQQIFEEIIAMIEIFLSKEYEGGRHNSRIDELDKD